MMEQIVDNLLGFPSVFRHLNQSDLKFSIIQFYIKQGLFAEMKASHRGRVGNHTENVISFQPFSVTINLQMIGMNRPKAFHSFQYIG